METTRDEAIKISFFFLYYTKSGKRVFSNCISNKGKTASRMSVAKKKLVDLWSFFTKAYLILVLVAGSIMAGHSIERREEFWGWKQNWYK